MADEEKYHYLYLKEDAWKGIHSNKEAHEFIGLGLQLIWDYEPLSKALDSTDWHSMLTYHFGNLIREAHLTELSTEKLKRYVADNKDKVSNLQQIFDDAIKFGRENKDELEKKVGELHR